MVTDGGSLTSGVGTALGSTGPVIVRAAGGALGRTGVPARVGVRGAGGDRGPVLGRGGGAAAVTLADPVVHSGRGAFGGFPDTGGARRVLVVASAGTVRRLDLARRMPRGATLFTDFHPNSTVGQAVAAAVRHALAANLVVGIGGGSALDIAKAARVLPPDPAATEVIASARPVRRAAQLLLVPTTAGSGSEVTPFATLYRGSRKVSLDAPGVAADTALVDPALTDTCPPDLSWSCAFDAHAHAVESLWSVRSTADSRACALAALDTLTPILRDAGPCPTPAQRDRLSAAATAAGRAIAITRTTAAHALAYPLTAHLGIPHGLACALNLTWLAPLVEEAGADVTDPCGARQVAGAVADIRRRLAPAGTCLGDAIRELLAARGLPARLPAHAGDLVDVFVAEGLASNRMTGTPVRVPPDHVRAALAGQASKGDIAWKGAPDVQLPGDRAGRGAEVHIGPDGGTDDQSPLHRVPGAAGRCDGPARRGVRHRWTGRHAHLLRHGRPGGRGGVARSSSSASRPPLPTRSSTPPAAGVRELPITAEALL